MKPRSVQIVPAGKRPKLKNQKSFFELLRYKIKKSIALVKDRGVRASAFMIASSFILVLSLVLYGYYSHYVYIVIFDGREIGAVRKAEEAEGLIDELTKRFYDYYGMAVEPGNRVKLVKDYRPDTVPDPWSVQQTIRQEITFLTDAYLLLIDGNPLVPVASETVLEEVIDYLQSAFINENNRNRIIDIYVVEDLTLKPCAVAPRDLFSSEEIITLLFDKKADRNIEAAYWAQGDRSSFTGHHQTYLHATPGSGLTTSSGKLLETDLVNSIINTGVNVQSVEELVVTDIIPHDIEIIYDEEMWIVQNEISIPGVDGRKETVFHITRLNGEEVDRTAVGEKMIREPVTQVETQGTAQVPARGTGQFIWPVAGGGEVTPGRGFSSWHTGVDIDARPGTKIYAADSGVVWYSGFGGSQGNYIIIYHGNYWTVYLHNQSNLVKKGETVKQGDVIARVGSTGRSTGPHLHFEVRRDDGSGEWRAYYQHKPVDPLRFFRP